MSGRLIFKINVRAITMEAFTYEHAKKTTAGV